MELRIGTKSEQCLKHHALWGSCHRCGILVPFHNLRTNSGGLEKRYPWPPSILKDGNLKFDLLWSLCKNSKLYGEKVRNQIILDSNDHNILKDFISYEMAFLNGLNIK
jgi:hypothetical protein